MTYRGLALTLRSHIPSHIKRAILNAMMHEDERRFEMGELLVNKDELMALAQKEGFLSEFEPEYHWMDLEGALQSHAISVPCYMSPPPLIAYACFSGLISGEDTIPEDDHFGFHTSSLQLAAAELSR